MSEPNPALRMCFTCCIEKPADQFSKSKPNSCLACIREQARSYYQNNPALRERMKAASLAYYQANRDEVLVLSRATWRAKKATAIAIYGDGCAKCGSDDRLEFDHVLADGAEHRKRESNTSMILRIARTGTRLPDVQIQLLCHEHHWEKTLAERRARRAKAS